MKPFLIKMDLFTTSFMLQKSDDGSMFSFACFISSGNLRMPETLKGSLVVTFSFAFANNAPPTPSKERSVAESS